MDETLMHCNQSTPQIKSDVTIPILFSDGIRFKVFFYYKL